MTILKLEGRMRRKPWTRQDLLRALVAYLALPHEERSNPPKEFVTVLAERLGRSFGSTSIRLANFVARDQEMIARGAVGMTSGGAHVDTIWNEFLDGNQLDIRKLLKAAALEL